LKETLDQPRALKCSKSTKNNKPKGGGSADGKCNSPSASKYLTCMLCAMRWTASAFGTHVPPVARYRHCCSTKLVHIVVKQLVNRRTHGFLVPLNFSYCKYWTEWGPKPDLPASSGGAGGFQKQARQGGLVFSRRDPRSRIDLLAFFFPPFFHAGPMLQRHQELIRRYQGTVREHLYPRHLEDVPTPVPQSAMTCPATIKLCISSSSYCGCSLADCAVMLRLDCKWTHGFLCIRYAIIALLLIQS